MNQGKRYATLVLVLWAILAPGGALVIAIDEINATAHKFCQVVTAATAVKVSPPADPVKNVSQERSWEWYVRYLALSNSLGCNTSQQAGP